VKSAITIRSALDAATRRLTDARLDDAAHDATSLLAHATSLSRFELVLDGSAALEPETNARFEDLVGRRAAREPLQHLIGSVGFHDVELEVTSDVLVPRPETELLVEAVLEWLEDHRLRSPRVLDLGTGSGAIAVALAANMSRGLVVASDRSRAALAVARRNVARTDPGVPVSLVAGDWFGPFSGAARFDVVVSNPPYIATDEIPGLDPEVHEHDPRIALDGGADGLDPYRVICGAGREFLRAPGLLALEVAAARPLEVVELVKRAGFTDVRVRPDLDGHPRVVLAAR
jgi:release factor glutamine methyltransferase